LFRSTQNKSSHRPATSPRLGSPSILSVDFQLSGNIRSDGEVHIDGVVTGDIYARRITVGASATITGSLEGEAITVSGTVHGLIKGGAVSLTRTARVYADITHGSLAIDAGALFDGNCRPMTTDNSACVSPVPTELLEVVNSTSTNRGRKTVPSVEFQPTAQDS
jgi:cytoskeletal protein CcmA (bactofilin family)